MAWAVIAAVVLILLVVSSGFRKVAAVLGIVVAVIGGAVYVYTKVDQTFASWRIAPSELVLDDLELRVSEYSGYELSGRIQNTSATYSLESVELVLSMSDCMTPLSSGQLVRMPDQSLFQVSDDAARPDVLRALDQEYGASWREAVERHESLLDELRARAPELSDEERQELRSRVAEMANTGQRSTPAAVPTGLLWYDTNTGNLEPADCIAIDERTETVRREIPPGQARDFSTRVYFSADLVPRGRLVWSYTLSETMGR